MISYANSCASVNYANSCASVNVVDAGGKTTPGQSMIAGEGRGPAPAFNNAEHGSLAQVERGEMVPGAAAAGELAADDGGSLDG
jgi:hypothetical protein